MVVERDEEVPGSRAYGGRYGGQVHRVSPMWDGSLTRTDKWLYASVVSTCTRAFRQRKTGLGRSTDSTNGPCQKEADPSQIM
jgi:hypothetical protein